MALTVDRRRDLLIDLADAVQEKFDELAPSTSTTTRFPISLAGTLHALERFLRHFAGYVDKPHGSSSPVNGSFDVNLVEREPYGVVGVIAPWNGALVVAGSCVAPALAAGNAVMFKPSELAPLAAMRFGELCVEAGLPAGLVNVVPAGADGGEALVEHPGIGKIHFTGGGATARKVLQSAAINLTPVVAELGGKSANIVFADADLDTAAMLSAHQGPLMQSGQSCACASRVLVHESIYDTFVEKFLTCVTTATIGDPFDPTVMFGPVISTAAVDAHTAGNRQRRQRPRRRASRRRASHRGRTGRRLLHRANRFRRRRQLVGRWRKPRHSDRSCHSSGSATKPKRCGSPTTPPTV